MIKKLMPINILYIIDSLTHGGTEKQLVQLINNLDRTRFQPQLCTLKASEGLYDEMDIPKVCLNFQSFFSPSIVSVQRRLVGFIKQQNIQIVQTFFQDPFLLAALVKPATGVKLIGSFRDLGFWRTKTESIKMRLACRFFDGFIANSQAVKDVVVATDKIPPAKIDVIYNGIDLTTLPEPLPVDQRHDAVVGIVANLNRPVKRAEDFVLAASLAAKQQPAARFVVIGGGHLQPELEQLATSLGLAGRITFTGRVDNPLDYVREFSVGVITSETEGFCNAIVEYMALGVPVVATDTGGNPEIVQPQQNGYLYPVGDCQQLADYILDLLNEPQLRQTIATNNQQKIQNDYTLTAMTKQHEDYYHQLFNTKLNKPLTQQTQKTPHPINCFIYTTPAQFDALQTDWQRLEQQSADPDFYLTWDWFYAVTHLSQQPPQQFRLFVARKAGEVVGIVPCMLVDKKWRLCHVRALELLGNLYSPRRGVVVEKGLEQQLAQSFLTYLQQVYQQEWDLFDFIDLSPGDKFMTELCSLLKLDVCGKLLFSKKDQFINVVTNLSDFKSGSDFFESLSKKMRSNINRGINKFNKDSRCFHIIYFDLIKSDTDGAFNMYKYLYEKSWKKSEYDETFHEKLMKYLSDSGKIRLYFLCLDDQKKTGIEKKQLNLNSTFEENLSNGLQPVSVLLCINHNQTSYVLKTAYDNDYKEFSPTKILCWYAFRHLIDVDGCLLIDRQKGDESHKYEWNGYNKEVRYRFLYINKRSILVVIEFLLTGLFRKIKNFVNKKYNINN